MSDTFISGCGVFPDSELGTGIRLRLSPTGNPSEDVEVYVEDGHVHIVSHYGRLSSGYLDANHVVARSVVPRA